MFLLTVRYIFLSNITVTQLIRKLPCLMEPNTFFSWSGNFLSYGTKHLYLKVHSYAADQKTSFSCGTQHLFQLIRKLPYIMEPNNFSSWSENFLILWNPALFRLIRKLSSLVEPKTFFSWSENFLMLWNLTPFQLIRKLSYLMAPNTFLTSSQWRGWSENFLLLWNPTLLSADQKTPFSCGTQNSLSVYTGNTHYCIAHWYSAIHPTPAHRLL